MPSIGGPELLLILAVVLIVFGAGKLPDVLGQLGKVPTANVVRIEIVDGAVGVQGQAGGGR